MSFWYLVEVLEILGGRKVGLAVIYGTHDFWREGFAAEAIQSVLVLVIGEDLEKPHLVHRMTKPALQLIQHNLASSLFVLLIHTLCF